MATSVARQHYVKTFAQQLVSSTTGEISEAADGAIQEVVEETFCESLQRLEDRFSAYLASCSQLTEASTLRATINRSENKLKTKFKSIINARRSFNLDSAHRQALRKCCIEITKDLDLPGSSLLDDLMECDLLSVSDKDSIRGQSTRKRQNEEFYASIEGRLTYDDFYNKFLPALRKDHPHLSDSLITVLDQLEDEDHESVCLPCRARSTIQLKRLAAPLLQKKFIDFPMYLDLRSHGISNNTKWLELKKTVSDGEIIDALEKKYADLHIEFLQSEVKSLGCVCPSQDLTDCYKMEQDAESEQKSYSDFETCATDFSEFDEVEEGLDVSLVTDDLEGEYRMTANPRGLCLVVNNVKFVSLPQRNFSHHDVLKIEETFKRLQFDVRLSSDLTAEGLMKKTQEYAQMDHSAYDAFVCVIMSHGSTGVIMGSDDMPLKQEAITHPFTASNCPSLAGKPKIFLIQAARGRELMSSYQKDEVYVADGADFVIGHCTAEGFVSFRSTRGSHFIDALQKVLQKNADKCDFLSCLTMVNQDLAERTMSKREVKQVSTPVFSLTKKLYLPTDPAWPH